MPKFAVATPVGDGTPTRKEVGQRGGNHSFDVSQVKKFTPEFPTKRAMDEQWDWFQL